MNTLTIRLCASLGKLERNLSKIFTKVLKKIELILSTEKNDTK